MSEQVALQFRNYNPDVLTCIANLSNDEVFTPPEFANRMLDTLEQAWADANGGANIWSDPDVTFLDPFTKSGVFLREITRRLTDGLEERLPDLDERVDHILTKQVFGIGITQLTSLLARRSLYCSKSANGPHSIASSFETEEGNIWFERTEHTWAGGRLNHALLDADGHPVLEGRRCRYCGASEDEYRRSDDLETHAYAFIHTDDINARIAELFGADMQFDVIIGNPPYQLSDGGAGASASPIYQRFVRQAKALEARFLAMVVPSRWMAGGRGLEDFRAEMLADRQIATLVDFPLATDVFDGTEIKGGVCYFLRSASHDGPTSVTQIRGSDSVGPVDRDLTEFDVFVRDTQAVEILHKVLARREESLSGAVSTWRPFGFNSDFSEFRAQGAPDDLVLHYVRPGKRLVGYVSRGRIGKGTELVDSWKLLAPEAYNGGDALPHQILGKPIMAAPGEVCTGTYLAIGPLSSEEEARSLRSYYTTRFFRFLVSLRKITQHTARAVYEWVPLQTWDHLWTDAALYEKYGLTDTEVTYIESMIRPMELPDA